MLTEAEKKELDSLKAKETRTKDEQERMDALTAKADAGGGDTMYGETYVKALRQEAAKYRTRAKEIEEKLAAFDGIDPEEVKKLLKERAEGEKKKLEARGDFDKLREQLAEQHKGELAKKETAINELTGKVQSLEGELNRTIMAHEVATAAAVAKAINPKLVEMVAMANMQVEALEDGRRVIRVLDKERQTRIDLKTGQPFSVTQYIEEMKQVEEYAHLFAGAKPGAGSGSTFTFQGQRVVNPWKKDTLNLTLQGQILKTDPNLAKRLKDEAGVQ